MKSPLRQALHTGPNLITLSRLALVAAAALTFWAGAVGPGLCLGAAAGITDYLDGWWARRSGQVSRLGEILDQFCDVALELVMLVMAVALDVLPAAVLIPYVLREVWAAGLRRFAIEYGQNIPSRYSGKLKSAFLGWSCLPLFLGATNALGGASSIALVIGQVGIGLGLGLSLLSAIGYTRDFVTIYDHAFRLQPDRMARPASRRDSARLASL